MTRRRNIIQLNLNYLPFVNEKTNTTPVLEQKHTDCTDSERGSCFSQSLSVWCVHAQLFGPDVRDVVALMRQPFRCPRSSDRFGLTLSKLFHLTSLAVFFSWAASFSLFSVLQSCCFSALLWFLMHFLQFSECFISEKTHSSCKRRRCKHMI